MTAINSLYDPNSNRTHEPREAPAPAIRSEHEMRLLAIVGEHRREGEATSGAFRRKEAEIGDVFAEMTPVESLAMQRRLTAPKPGDMLAQKFAVMTVERRNRLLALLAEVRRRGVTAQQVAGR